MIGRGTLGALWAGLVALMSVGSASAQGAADHRLNPPPAGIEMINADLYRSTVMTGNLLGLTTTNYGFVGNNFTSRAPSFEYPLGTGFEHMVRGGLWIGAIAVNDSGRLFTGVTTGTVDGNAGASSQSATEFTPTGSDIVIRSTLQNSDKFDEHAISERDFIANYRDHIPRLADETGERHRPLRVLVRQENYEWSFSDLKNFVILHYEITNDGPPLSDVWLAMYAELASGPKNAYSTWYPTAAGGGAYGTWFNKKVIAFDDSLRLFREHYCYSSNGMNAR